MVLDPWLKVAGLKSPSGGWDSNLIWSSFLPDEAHIILNIPCSSTAHHDSLLWHYSKTGHYSVKSGYWAALNHQFLLSSASCSNSGSQDPWKTIWRVNLPSKIKLFLWKACRGWLPTFQVLQRRHMQVPVCCPCCGLTCETIQHSLWFCKSLSEEQIHS
ncbi:hypothetical protein ACOSQ2_004668 [Xanthoceras sorbifolium]